MRSLAILLALVMPANAFAGLYSSRETYADLPSQWRGFLMDQRTLRLAEGTPLRKQSLDAVKKLDPKTADDIADLGALLIRLGQVDRAIEVLRGGQAKHPNHFAIAANLGTAWQLKGDLPAAAESLRQAVRLAPGRLLAAEELHLKLVLGRMKQKQQELDDLFGIQYFTPKSDDITDEVKKKLTARQVGLVQQLALWLPADGPLLWQLAELANAFGDVRTAAALAEGCVTQFGMNHPDLRRRRLMFKAAVEKLPPIPLGDKIGHQPGHAGSLTFRSKKPLVGGLDESSLPAIAADGVNPVPWEIFSATQFEGKFPPKFGAYLKQLDGKTVSLSGYLQPLREDGSAFLFIESPVGCWYCEMPEMTGIIVLDPPADRAIRYERGLLRVIGRLSLNTTDPESFLYTLHDAKVAPVD